MIAESMGRGGLGPVPLEDVEADLQIRRLHPTVAFGPSFRRETKLSAKSPEIMLQVALLPCLGTGSAMVVGEFSLIHGGSV